MSEIHFHESFDGPIRLVKRRIAARVLGISRAKSYTVSWFPKPVKLPEVRDELFDLRDCDALIESWKRPAVDPSTFTAAEAEAVARQVLERAEAKRRAGRALRASPPRPRASSARASGSSDARGSEPR